MSTEENQNTNAMEQQVTESDQNKTNTNNDLQKTSTSQQKMNGNQQQNQEEEYDLETIMMKSLEDLPIKIEAQKELMYFLENGVLKGIDQQKLREYYIKLIGQPNISKLIVLSFWFVFVIKFPGCVEPEPELLIKQMRAKMSKKYVKIFSNLPQMKDELVNYLIYTLGWMVHYLFYKLFSKQRFFFDLRFIIDCYHTLIYEFNGIYVSDQYIRTNLERLFTNRFLCYESLGKSKRKPINQTPTKFLGNFEFLQPQISSMESQQFKQILDDKFKVKKKPQVQVQQHDDLYTEILRDNLLQKTGKHHKSQGNIVRTSSVIDINSKKASAQNIDEKTNNNSHQRQMLPPFQGKSQGKSVGNSSSSEKLPYFGNLSINCTQVSPTIGKVLYYENMQLPFKKKKMIRHIMDNVSENQGSLIKKVKFYKNKIPKKESKHDKKQKEQLIDVFNLRIPNKEYYQKHDEHQDKLFKDMLDLNYVFSNYREGLPNLPSSTETLKNYQFYQKQAEAKKHMEQTLSILEQEQLMKKRFEEEQKKQRKQAQKGKFTDKIKQGKNVSNKVSPLNSQSNFDEITKGYKDKIENNHSNFPKINQQTSIIQEQSSSNQNQSNNNNMNTPSKQSFLGMVDVAQQSSAQVNINNKKKERDFYSALEQQNTRNIVTKILESQEEDYGSQDENWNVKEESDNFNKEDFTYTDKRAKYRDKYSNLGKYTSTDTNIDNLQMDLIQRQNMVKKGMAARIHRD